MQTLTALVKERAGLATQREGKKAVQAALGALRCALSEDDARLLAAALHPAFAAIFERAPVAPVANVAEFYAEAERRERVGLGFAMEHAQVVMQALAECLDLELLVRLRKHTSPDIAALLRERPEPADPPPHVHLHPPHEAIEVPTLSRSKPGTSEPISEAGHPLAHEKSVARTDAPHAEDMLETAHSPRSSREDETLSGYRGNVERK